MPTPILTPMLVGHDMNKTDADFTYINSSFLDIKLNFPFQLSDDEVMMLKVGLQIYRGAYITNI